MRAYRGVPALGTARPVGPRLLCPFSAGSPGRKASWRQLSRQVRLPAVAPDLTRPGNPICALFAHAYGFTGEDPSFGESAVDYGTPGLPRSLKLPRSERGTRAPRGSRTPRHAPASPGLGRTAWHAPASLDQTRRLRHHSTRPGGSGIARAGLGALPGPAGWRCVRLSRLFAGLGDGTSRDTEPLLRISLPECTICARTVASVWQRGMRHGHR
jgi:hypothetical protein